MSWFSKIGDFVKSAVETPLNQAQQIGDSFGKDPGRGLEQLALGAEDPASAKAWGALTGQNFTPNVSQMGGETGAQYAQARRDGINTTGGQDLGYLADAIAGGYAGSYGLGALGGAGGGAADAASAGVDSGSVNLFADALPGAGGDVGASALSDAATGGLDSGSVNLFSDAVPSAGGDVGASAFDGAIGPGGGADMLLGGGGGFDPYVNVNAEEFGGAYGAGPSTSSGFGGVGTDPGVAVSPDGGLALGQGAAAPGSAAGLNMQDALKTGLKYGPLGISLLKGVMGKDAANKAAAAYNNVGTQQRQTASGLVTAYNNGTLNPAESAGIDKWAQQQIASLRQFYANAGTADSTQAKQAEAAVMQQATDMKNKATQDLLKVGLNELNTLDTNTVRGITANLQGDQAAQQAQANFAMTFAKLIGSTGQTPTPSTSTTGP